MSDEVFCANIRAEAARLCERSRLLRERSRALSWQTNAAERSSSAAFRAAAAAANYANRVAGRPAEAGGVSVEGCPGDAYQTRRRCYGSLPNGRLRSGARSR